MINKQDIIRFVVASKVDALKSAIVLMTDDKRVFPYMYGDQITLAAALILVARKNPDFKDVLVEAVANLGEDGGEE